MNLSATFKVNNFDLIRLLAAAQVALYHAIQHLNPGEGFSTLAYVLSYVPGVPVFFFVSGFLVSKSYENNPALSSYVLNRALRVFPGLILCTVLALLVVWMTGYWQEKEIAALEFIGWVLSQVTFLQFYNPDFMRDFGTGVLNGSLWTISVELQFYVIIPILYGLFFHRKPGLHNTLLLGLIVLCLVMNVSFNLLDPHYDQQLWFKLLGVSFLPWIWMFLLGVFFQRNFATMHHWFAGRCGVILLCYVVVSYYLSNKWGLGLDNAINPVSYIGLALLVFSFAYTKPKLSEALLKGNDVSYGLYIYHMPVFNLFIYYGFTGSYIHVGAALGVALGLAALSWFMVEKTSMRLKRHSLFANLR